MTEEPSKEHSCIHELIRHHDNGQVRTHCYYEVYFKRLVLNHDLKWLAVYDHGLCPPPRKKQSRWRCLTHWHFVSCVFFFFVWNIGYFLNLLANVLVKTKIVRSGYYNCVFYILKMSKLWMLNPAILKYPLKCRILLMITFCYLKIYVC